MVSPIFPCETGPQLRSVYENRRRVFGPPGLTNLSLRHDPRPQVRGLTIGAKAGDIEVEGLGIGLEKVVDVGRIAPDRLALIKDIVHLPKFSLHCSSLRGQCRGHRMLVHFERELVKNDFHLVLVLLLQFVDPL